MRPLLAALLILALATAPVAAEGEGYSITPIGDRWHMVVLAELVIVPAGGRARVTVWLDDIPGGVDGTPYLWALPRIDRGSLAFSVTPASFAPLPYSTYPVPLVSAVLHNQSAAEEHYRIKVQVRGKE